MNTAGWLPALDTADHESESILQPLTTLTMTEPPPRSDGRSFSRDDLFRGIAA